MDEKNDAPRVEVWEERDRLHIHVIGADDRTIAEWWDDDARQMFEDGFFKSGTRSIGHLRQSDTVLTESVLAYCREMKLLDEDHHEPQTLRQEEAPGNTTCDGCGATLFSDMPACQRVGWRLCCECEKRVPAE